MGGGVERFGVRGVGGVVSGENSAVDDCRAVPENSARVCSRRRVAVAARWVRRLRGWREVEELRRPGTDVAATATERCTAAEAEVRLSGAARTSAAARCGRVGARVVWPTTATDPPATAAEAATAATLPALGASIT